MVNYGKRLHILLSESQYEILKDLSSRKKKPIGKLIREALEIVYFPDSKLEPIWALNELKTTKWIDQQPSKNIAERDMA